MRSRVIEEVAKVRIFCRGGIGSGRGEVELQWREDCIGIILLFGVVDIAQGVVRDFKVAKGQISGSWFSSFRKSSLRG